MENFKKSESVNSSLREALAKASALKDLDQRRIAKELLSEEENKFFARNKEIDHLMVDVNEYLMSIKEKVDYGLKRGVKFKLDNDGEGLRDEKGELTFEREESGELFDTGYESEANILDRAVLEVKDDNTYKAIMQLLRCKKELSILEEYLVKLTSVRNQNRDKVLPKLSSLIKRVRDKIEEIKENIIEIKIRNSEAYVMYNAMILIDYQKQLNGGKIVETPTVHKHVIELEEAMLEGNPILIQGPSGTGKTEVAKHVADKIKKLKINTIKAIEKAKRRVFKETDKEQKSQELKEAENTPAYYIVSGSKDFHYSEFAGTGGVRASGDAGAMETYFNYGPIYKAMEDGVPIIVDEANLIPPGILLKLNEYMTRRPGDTIRVQENGGKEIIIRKGFCIIYTGNVGAQFQDRFKLESSQRDRMGLVIDYDYVSNSIIPKEDEDKLKLEIENEQDENLKKSLEVELFSHRSQSELWHIMLSIFMDKKCRMSLPQGDEEDLWNLSKAIRYSQDVYAGRIDMNVPSIDGNPNPNKASTAIKDYQFSMRSLFIILKEYKKDTSYPLSYYINKKFLKEKLDNNKNAIAVYEAIFKMFGLVKEGLEDALGNAGEEYVDMESRDINTIEYSSRDTVRLAFGLDTSFETENSIKAYEKRFKDLETQDGRELREQEDNKRLLEEIQRLEEENRLSLLELEKTNKQRIKDKLDQVKQNKKALEEEQLMKGINVNHENNSEVVAIGVVINATERDVKAIEKTLDEKSVTFDYTDTQKVEGILKVFDDLIKKQQKLLVSQPVPINPTEIATRLKSLNSPFTVDTDIEGGTLNTQITKQDLEYINDQSKALAKFTSSQTAPAYITPNFQQLPWNTLQESNLDTIILNPNGYTIPNQRDKLVRDMDSMGYRPLTVTELTLIAIKHPKPFEGNNQPYIFNSYTKHDINSVSSSPCFGWGGGGRRLGANDTSVGWLGYNRFLFVRK